MSTANLLLFLTDCSVTFAGGHDSTGQSGASGGSASTYQVKNGTSTKFTSGFNGYTTQSWTNQITLQFSAGDTFKMTSTTSTATVYPYATMIIN